MSIQRLNITLDGFYSPGRVDPGTTHTRSQVHEPGRFSELTAQTPV